MAKNKTAIYYFSATGNTLVLARDLAHELDADLIPVQTLLKKEKVKSTCDTVILSFPVYFWGSPLIINDFVRKLELKKGAKLYVCASYGGMLANSMNVFKKIARKSGIKIEAGYAVRMPGNYQPWYNVFNDELQKSLAAYEKTKIKEIADSIKKGEHGFFRKNLALKGLLLSHLVYPIVKRMLPTLDKYFWLAGNCNGCGICAKVCPVKNIVMNDSRPTWDGKCEQCLACMHWCPQKDIQFWKRTINHDRYHHPAVKIKDIIA